jgi:single-stranded DNA-binding protein
MSNDFRGTGNAGDDAALKTVIVANQEKHVAELSVYFDAHPSADPSEGGKDRGFWLDVTVWDVRHAAEVARHVKKGARVHVVGRLAEHRWTVTATGEERSALHLNAERLYLALTRVAEVKFHPDRRRSGANS